VSSVFALASSDAYANHGPGTSGGGSSTASGETLKLGAWDFTLRFDVTQFESVSDAESRRRALKAGDFDSLRRAEVTTFGVAYGVTDEFQLGAQIGWYEGRHFTSAEDDGMGGTTLAHADPHGLTDLWLNAKYRLFENHGQLALIGGVKLPTGDDDERLDDGSRLEPSSQPGTGAVDLQFGLAWSRYLTPRVTLDASALYTRRGDHDHFRVGDRADVGVALAYRLTESVKEFPNWSVSAELTDVWIGKDVDHGAANENSGGDSVLAAAGLRVRLSPRLALTLAPSLPLVQDLNGEQVKVRWKVALALSFSF
jgi:hypothetical protein